MEILVAWFISQWIESDSHLRASVFWMTTTAHERKNCLLTLNYVTQFVAHDIRKVDCHRDSSKLWINSIKSYSRMWQKKRQHNWSSIRIGSKMIRSFNFVLHLWNIAICWTECLWIVVHYDCWWRAKRSLNCVRVCVLSINSEWYFLFPFRFARCVAIPTANFHGIQAHGPVIFHSLRIEV